MMTEFRKNDISNDGRMNPLELLCVHERRDKRMFSCSCGTMSFPLERLRFVAKKNPVTSIAGRFDVPLILAIRSSRRGSGSLRQMNSLSRCSVMRSGLSHEPSKIFEKDRVRLLQISLNIWLRWPYRDPDHIIHVRAINLQRIVRMTNINVNFSIRTRSVDDKTSRSRTYVLILDKKI